MDAVELARRRAAALHDDAVSNGADPWNPEAIANAVAFGLGLDIEPIETGSVILAGGRAGFHRRTGQSGTRDSGSDFYKAFLVAHELGHATLGDDRGRTRGSWGRPDQTGGSGAYR